MKSKKWNTHQRFTNQTKIHLKQDKNSLHWKQ